MSKRRQHSELVWITPNSGFGAGGRYAVIMPEGLYLRSPDRAVTDQNPCMLDCDDQDCMEWTDLFTLPGNNRAEAMQNLIAGRYSGVAYHASECEMLTQAPRGWTESDPPAPVSLNHAGPHMHSFQNTVPLET